MEAADAELAGVMMQLDGVRATVASKAPLAAREGAAKDSKKLGALDAGAAIALEGLARTPSGTLRARTTLQSRGGTKRPAWVTASKADGKQLLQTEEDLEALLDGAAAELESVASVVDEKIDEAAAISASPKAWEDMTPDEQRAHGAAVIAKARASVASAKEAAESTKERVAGAMERARQAQADANSFNKKWDDISNRFDAVLKNSLDRYAAQFSLKTADRNDAKAKLAGGEAKARKRPQPVVKDIPVNATRTEMTGRLTSTPFMEHDHKLFMHGRGYSGPAKRPKTTWRSKAKPRDDHYASDWLTASEFEDVPEVSQHKVAQLAELLRMSRRTVLYTGAGISASVVGQSARSGVNKVGWKASPSMANPTFTHQALALLCEKGLVQSWVQQNHDGLPQKAGAPQAVMNEIHGSWFDPSNPVVKFSGSLQGDLVERMEEDQETADLVLVLGTSLGGLNADRTATWPAQRSLSEEDPALGSVMINLQQTDQDGKMTLRMFGTSDSLLKMLLAELGLPTRFKAPEFSRERRVLVPYDKDGNPIEEGQPRMWWDLRGRAEIQITDGNNIQGANQPCFMHIFGNKDVKHKGRTLKHGPGRGFVGGRSDTAKCIDLEIEGATMKLGLWWITAAQQGAVEKLPIVNRAPEFEGAPADDRELARKRPLAEALAAKKK